MATRNMITKFIADTRVFNESVRGMISMTKEAEQAIRRVNTAAGSMGSDFDRRLMSKDMMVRRGAMREFDNTMRASMPGSSAGDRRIALGQYKDELNMRTLAEKTMQASSGLMGFIGKLGMAGAALSALKGVIQTLSAPIMSIVRAGSEVETDITSLRVYLRDSEEARQTYFNAIEQSYASPFTTGEMVAGARTMAQFGITDSFTRGAYGLPQGVNVMQLLEGLGSFQGLSGQKTGIERAAHSVSRGETRLLWPYRGYVQQAHDTALAAGQRGSYEYVTTFLREIAKVPQILEMANEQAFTMQGLWSTILDLGENFFVFLSGAIEKDGVITFWSQLREIMIDIRNWAVETMNWYREPLMHLGSFLMSIFRGSWDVLKSIFIVVRAIWRVLEPIVGPILLYVINVLATTFRVIGTLVLGIVELILSLVRLIATIFGVNESMDKFKNAFYDWVLGQIVGLQLYEIALKGFFERAGGYLQEMFIQWETAITRFLNRNRGLREFIMILSGQRGILGGKASPSKIAAQENPDTIESLPWHSRLLHGASIQARANALARSGAGLTTNQAMTQAVREFRQQNNITVVNHQAPPVQPNPNNTTGRPGTNLSIPTNPVDAFLLIPRWMMQNSGIE